MCSTFCQVDCPVLVKDICRVFKRAILVWIYLLDCSRVEDVLVLSIQFHHSGFKKISHVDTLLDSILNVNITSFVTN